MSDTVLDLDIHHKRNDLKAEGGKFYITLHGRMVYVGWTEDNDPKLTLVDLRDGQLWPVATTGVTTEYELKRWDSTCEKESTFDFKTGNYYENGNSDLFLCTPLGMICISKSGGWLMSKHRLKAEYFLVTQLTPTFV